MIRQYKITKRSKIRPPALNENSNFYGKRVGTVSLEDFFKNDHFSLYCLGPDDRSFTFVDGSDSDQLKNATFVYQTQFAEARNLFNVPMAYLEKRSQRIDADPVFLFSVGRCGSTLLNHLFGALNGSFTLSEPDIYYYLYCLLEFDSAIASVIPDISYLATHNLIMGESFRSAAPLIIKHRSQAFPIADLLTARMPGCKKIFLHRNPESWFASMRRTFGSDITYVADYWIEMAKKYEQFKNQGIDFISVAYEDFMENPSAVFKYILANCEISESLSDDEINQILEKDSQQDSRYSRQKLKHKPMTNATDISDFMKKIEGYETAFKGK